MKLWIIDDSNSTASAVLEDAEVEALINAVNNQIAHSTALDAPFPQALKSLALRLSKLGLAIEGL